MEQLFLIPACSKEALENMEKSIYAWIDLGRLCEEHAINLKHVTIKGDAEEPRVKVWGTKAAKKACWDKMNPGDWTMFYVNRGDGACFEFAGIVSAVIDSPKLAELIWGSDEYRYIHIYGETQNTHLNAKCVFEYLGYSLKNLRGFMRVSDRKWKSAEPGFTELSDFLVYLEEVEQLCMVAGPVETQQEKPRQMLDKIEKFSRNMLQQLKAEEITLPVKTRQEPPARIKAPSDSRETTGTTPDFLQLNRVKGNIGALGEEIIYQIEKQALRTAGRNDLAESVEIVSKKSNRYGYDILSYEADGQEKHIEVKSTTRGKDASFEMTYREYDRMQTDMSFMIFRIYGLRVKENTIDFDYYVLEHNNKDKLRFRPLVYRVHYNDGER